jgi:peptide/nickel transport system substrate-binding protein/oligopeptide transport system substrate-binding protein
VYRKDACGEALGHDPAAARAELAAAGIDQTALQVGLYRNDEGPNLQLARAVAAQWRSALGLRVLPTALTFDDYLARGTSAKGFDGAFRFSWATPYADPDGSLYPLFASDRIGRDNFSRFSDRDVDFTLIRQAREAEDSADRTADYRRIERLLCARMPMIPLTFSLSRYLVAPSVRSAAPTYVDRTTGQIVLREAYLRRP